MAHGNLRYEVRHPVLEADPVAGEQWTHSVHIATLTASIERVQIVIIPRRAVLAPQPLHAVHRKGAHGEQDVRHLYSDGPRFGSVTIWFLTSNVDVDERGNEIQSISPYLYVNEVKAVLLDSHGGLHRIVLEGRAAGWEV